jgi:hypothetical protein
MSDQVSSTETTTVTTESTSATPPAQTAAQPRVFTQEEVDAIVTSRLARAEKPRPVQAPAPVPAKAAAPATNEAITASDVQQMITRQGDFRELLGGAGLDAEQRQSVQSLFAAANPQDVSTWWNTTIAPLKLGKPPAPPAVTSTTTPAASAATTTAPETPRAPVATMPQAPTGAVNPITSGGLVDLFSMSVAQLQQLGPAKVRTELEKMWAQGNATNGAPQRPKAPGR